jgi:hypothetical protein
LFDLDVDQRRQDLGFLFMRLNLADFSQGGVQVRNRKKADLVRPAGAKSGLPLIFAFGVLVGIFALNATSPAGGYPISLTVSLCLAYPRHLERDGACARHALGGPNEIETALLLGAADVSGPASSLFPPRADDVLRCPR